MFLQIHVFGAERTQENESLTKRAVKQREERKEEPLSITYKNYNGHNHGYQTKHNDKREKLGSALIVDGR